MNAYNYNSLANTSDTCYYDPGCTNPGYLQYYTQNFIADIDDGSCTTPAVFGCMDSIAFNYDSTANVDNGGCVPVILGCMNELAFNYNPSANTPDTCELIIYGCIDPTMYNFCDTCNTEDGSCEPYVFGCTDSTMFNYNPLANTNQVSETDLTNPLNNYGKSKLLKVNYKNGQIFKEIKLPNQYFAEGLTILDDKIHLLTWKEKVGFIYDTNFNEIKSFNYNLSKEGWGICNDKKHLYKSDGTEKIWKLDSESQNEENYIEVYTDKNKVVGLNELEWINGKIFANRYLFNGIAIINPKNGAVESVINLSTLKDKVTQHKQLDVINGIAYNSKRKTIFVTGKMWDNVFEIKIINNE